MRTVFVNGEYLKENEANISIFDRGFLFGDAVYEVTAVLGGKLAEFDNHMNRLKRSLGELDMALEMDKDSLLAMHRELVVRNNIEEGAIYLQISRGAADRDFLFPSDETPTTIVAFTQEKSLIDTPLAKRGMKVNLVEDLRWQRSDIKTVQLLYSSLMKSRAHKAGADDVWLARDGMVTEGSSNNAYIVTYDGEIITRPLSTDILHGITRQSLLSYIQKEGLKLTERAFSIEEAKAAKEAFVTSASAFVIGVISIDGEAIGDGKVGSMTKALREIYINETLKALI